MSVSACSASTIVSSFGEIRNLKAAVRTAFKFLATAFAATVSFAVIWYSENMAPWRAIAPIPTTASTTRIVTDSPVRPRSCCLIVRSAMRHFPQKQESTGKNAFRLTVCLTLRGLSQNTVSNFRRTHQSLKWRLSLIWSQAQTTSCRRSSSPRSPPFISGCKSLTKLLYCLRISGLVQ